MCSSDLRGDDFRTDYSRLAMLCASFPGVPVVALTATASKKDILAINDSLNLKNPLKVIANPNRPNIFMKKSSTQVMTQNSLSNSWGPLLPC